MLCTLVVVAAMHMAVMGETPGGWSRWTLWYGCTVTCGGGVSLRERKCDQPAPTSPAGNCVGDEVQTKACNTYACPAPEIVRDGGWGTWAPWFKCTISCGGGVKVRDRKCDNPPPNHRGRGCMGSDHEFAVCGSEACPVADLIAFSVASSTRFAPSERTRVPFEETIYNKGGYFHHDDNAFHAPVRGVYSFSFSGMGDVRNFMGLNLFTERPGQAKYMVATAYDSSLDGHNAGAGASVIVELDAGETASIWMWGGALYGRDGVWSRSTLFSGKLERQLD